MPRLLRAAMDVGKSDLGLECQQKSTSLERKWGGWARHRGEEQSRFKGQEVRVVLG